ncbi:MAG: phosphoribosyltransferase [Pseudolabrys sp.]|nr:phosphoribosyltransferase [Pseudolabrys sp.]
MQEIKNILDGRRPRIVAVHAEEAQGRNKIPMAYGEVLGGVLGLDTDPGIVQSSVANHGSAPSIYHRFVSPPCFDGYVEAGAEYLLVDDTCTAGGTLANLKGFIENRGGKVVMMSCLASNQPRLRYAISLSRPTFRQLGLRHPQLHDWWIEEFGYGTECLTEGEAGNLRVAPSFDTIRNRLAEARRDLNLDSNEGVDEGAPDATEMVDRAPSSQSSDKAGG